MCSKCGNDRSLGKALIEGLAGKGGPLEQLLEKQYDRHAQDLAPMFEEYDGFLNEFESPALAWLAMAGRISEQGRGTDWLAQRLAACMALATGAMLELEQVQKQRDGLLEKYEPETRKVEEVIVETPAEEEVEAPV